MNNEEKSRFWVEVVCGIGKYSNPQLLKEHLDRSTFSEFCDCGCNSFKVEIDKSAGLSPISKLGKYGPIFECDFYLGGESVEPRRTLEIIIFTDEDGYISYFEVDCCANSYPVPDKVDLEGEPFHVYQHS